MTPRRAPLPLLTRAQVIALVAIAVLLRVSDLPLATEDVSAAWFFAVVGLVWSALQTVWDIASTALSYALRVTLIGLRWAVTDLGKAVATGLARAAIYTAKVLGVVWRGLRFVFEPVLRWFGKVIDVVSGFLRRVFQPIIDWLIRARTWIWQIYDKFVRPVLDVLDLLRQVFRLLATLGIEWARAIDRALGRISAVIQFPFRWIVDKINEVIGVINRIVTLDGLLQRLTLMRSLIRDVRLTTNLFHNYQTIDISPGELTALNLRNAVPHPEDADHDLQQYLETRGGGALAPKIDELIAETMLIARNQRVISGEP